MEKFTAKRRTKPTSVCQYGSNCYRKNPHHFMEYAHQHLDNIIERNTTECNIADYKIPSELILHRSTILEQLKILIDLFPSIKLEPVAKKEKSEVASITEDGSAKKASASVVVHERANKIVTNSAASSSTTISTSALTKAVQSAVKTQEKAKENSIQTHQMSSAHNIHDYIKVVLPKGKMAQKLVNAHPYNYFLTAITSSSETHTEPLSITFQEILDPSLGELECSVQINFMVDIGWLLGHYHFAGYLEKPLLVLYGNDTPELKTISLKKPQVTAHFVQMGNPFATHHTKMMLLGYKDKSMRVVVSTANLYEDDWHNRVQGLWMSQRLEQLPENADTAAGESPTEFRNELLKYLTSYNNSKLQPWLTRIRKSNFESINVFLVTSVPGTHHEGVNGYPHGHARVGWLLSKHSAPIDDTSAIVAQSSSIGSFGANSNVWLTSEFLNSFRRDSKAIGLRKSPQIKLIYPSFNNVINSYDGLLGGGCLPYGNQIHQKQEWLKQYMYQWKANCRFRSKSMPHIKTYCRWSDKKLFWFVLTSANLSKAAWGSFNKSAKINVPIRINNYEAGVLFLPKFITKSDYFLMEPSDVNTPVFPSLYDIPLSKYSIDDTPFLSDILFGE